MKKSVFTDKGALNSLQANLKKATGRVQVITTAFSSGELTADRYKEATKSLQHCISVFDDAMQSIQSSVHTADDYVGVISDGSIGNVMLTNLSLSKTSAELAISAMMSDNEDDMSLDDALNVEDEEENEDEDNEEEDSEDSTQKSSKQKKKKTSKMNDDYSEDEEDSDEDSEENEDEGEDDEDSEDSTQKASKQKSKQKSSKQKCSKKKTSKMNDEEDSDEEEDDDSEEDNQDVDSNKKAKDVDEAAKNEDKKNGQDLNQKDLDDSDDNGMGEGEGSKHSSLNLQAAVSAMLFKK